MDENMCHTYITLEGRLPHVSPAFFLESTSQDFVQKEGSRGGSSSNESLMVLLMFPSKEWETGNRNCYSDLQP